MTDSLQENPWQTEACIGQWAHYSRPLFEKHGYQKATLMIPLFVDQISRLGDRM